MKNNFAPNPTYKDIFLEHYPNFDVSRFDEFADSLCVACCFDDGGAECIFGCECKKHWEDECLYEWRDNMYEHDLETINEFLIEPQSENETDETAAAVQPKVGDYVEEDMLGELLSFDELTEMVGQLAVNDCSTESRNWYKVVRIDKIYTNVVDGSRSVALTDGPKKNDTGRIGEYAFNYEGTHTLGGKKVPRAHRMWRLKLNTENAAEPVQAAENQLSYINKLREKYPKVSETDEWFDTVFCPSEFFDGDGVNDPADDKCSYTAKDFEACQKCWRERCPADVDFLIDPDFESEYFENYPDEEPAPENEPPEEITDGRKINIVYIGVNEIEPHPNNPRKDVGDVSELSEDIKENGIRQNLTVIPHEHGYRCLIGHRRLAAAKLAGLEQVPCAVENAGMSLSDQICIMLSENIQRADLTPIEQAESMQMMLDMGDTVDYISRKTGLSKSTVYRRINPIKEYGIETCRKAYEQGATFEDFSKLDEITDPKTRDKLAKSLGTSSFNFEYQRAVNDIKRNKKLDEVKELIKSFAGEISDDKKDELKYIDYITGWSASNFKKPDDTDTVKYFYIISDRGDVQLYREYTPDELKDREQKEAEISASVEKRRRTEERRAELKKRTDIAAELRHEFVIRFDPLKGCNSQKEQLARYKAMLEFWALTYISFEFNKCETVEYFIDNIGMEVTKEFDEMDGEQQDKAVETHIKKSRNWELKTLFDMMIAVLETYNLKYYNDYYLTYNECPALDMIYEILCSFGYEMSDEEKQLQDGSHELFAEGD